MTDNQTKPLPEISLANWDCTKPRVMSPVGEQPEQRATCQECNGSGQYVGWNVIETCRCCGGSGKA